MLAMPSLSHRVGGKSQSVTGAFRAELNDAIYALTSLPTAWKIQET